MRRLALALFLIPSFAVAAQPITAPGFYPPGEYYLANDITITTGTALVFNSLVTTDRAEVNLNGKTIHCVTTGNDVTIGISGNGPSNLIILGGGASWIDGCRYGVSTSRQTRVQEVVFTGIRYIAMNLSGPNSHAILNVVDGVGGVTDEAYAVGINVAGSGAVIRGNILSNLYRQVGAPPGLVGEGVGIILNATATGAIVEGNQIINDLMKDATYGVFSGYGAGHTIRSNVVKNTLYGVAVAGASTVDGNMFVASTYRLDSVAVSAGATSTVSNNTAVGYGVLVSGDPGGSDNLSCTP